MGQWEGIERDDKHVSLRFIDWTIYYRILLDFTSNTVND